MQKRAFWATLRHLLLKSLILSYRPTFTMFTIIKSLPGPISLFRRVTASWSISRHVSRKRRSVQPYWHFSHVSWCLSIRSISAHVMRLNILALCSERCRSTEARYFAFGRPSVGGWNACNGVDRSQEAIVANEGLWKQILDLRVWWLDI